MDWLRKIAFSGDSITIIVAFFLLSNVGFRFSKKHNIFLSVLGSEYSPDPGGENQSSFHNCGPLILPHQWPGLEPGLRKRGQSKAGLYMSIL